MSDFVDTPENREAGAYLKEARGERSQDVFAREISDASGVELEKSTYGYYERGERTVPAAVMLVAARLTGVPLPSQEADLTLGEQLKEILAEQRRLTKRQQKFENEIRERLGPQSGAPRRGRLQSAPGTP